MNFREWYKSSTSQPSFVIGIAIVLCFLPTILRAMFGDASGIVSGALVMAMGIGAIIAERELTPYLLLVYASLAGFGCWVLVRALHQYGII